MGECINLRRGGKQKKLPILNANYPADVSVEYNGNATFKVEIAEHGYPEEYTYQWYLDDKAVSGATNPSFTIYTDASSASTHPIRCDVTNKAGTVQSRTATLTVGSALPTYNYSGSHQFIDDGSGNWRIKFTSSGTLRFSNRGTGVNGIDVFCVGGGGSGAYSTAGGCGGGGGGYTNTARGRTIAVNTDYWIDVGSGGAEKSGSSQNGARGGTSGIGAFNLWAEGGYGGEQGNGGKGGNGGSGGGANDAMGGSDGSDGKYTWTSASLVGIGQHRTTREFAEGGATLYAGGGTGFGNDWYGGADGGGGAAYSPGTDGLGGGGGGGYWKLGARGGSGIVIIRNKR